MVYLGDGPAVQVGDTVTLSATVTTDITDAYLGWFAHVWDYDAGTDSLIGWDGSDPEWWNWRSGPPYPPGSVGFPADGQPHRVSVRFRVPVAGNLQVMLLVDASQQTGTLAVTRFGVYVTSAHPMVGVGGDDPVQVRGAGDRMLAEDADVDGSRLSALQELAADAGSLVFHTRDGQLVYETPDYRAGLAGASPSLTLLDGDILDAVSWTSRLDDVVTDVTVVYGHAVSDDERPRVRVIAPTVGDLPRAALIDSPLLDAVDAQALADRTIARWSTPSWTAPQIRTRDDLLDDTTYRALLDLDVSSVIDTSGVTGEPDLTGGVGRWVVEGWEETWDAPHGTLRHEVQLAVTELSRWT